MELTDLRIFLAAARCRSFSRAGRELYVSHSTVSRTVSALEKELGVCLMERNNRVLGLTPAGETLARECEHILSLTDSLPEKLKK